MRRLLFVGLMLTALGACGQGRFEPLSGSVDRCFFEPWRPNC